MKQNNIKTLISRDEVPIGPNLQIPSPWLIEIIAGAGFHYVMLDGEHGAAYSELPALIIAADGAGITPIVRVPSHDRAWLLPPLEFGAGGVQVPMVETAEQARYLVSEVKYVPLGTRGFSGVTRAARFGNTPASELAERGNADVMLIVQLESESSIRNSLEIARVPGVDMIFIGPSDLAQSLGVPGQEEAPVVTDAMEQVIKEVNGRVPVGTVARSASDVRRWRSAGISCFLTSSINPIRRAFEGLYSELAGGDDDRGRE